MAKKSISLLLLLLLFLAGCVSQEKKGPYTVVHVVDGDTLDLNNSWRIRLSGINTPEVGECYSEEATLALSNLTLGHDVHVERDYTNIDKYGRYLRYVYMDNMSINKYMVEAGYAKVFDKYKDDTKRYAEYKKAEEEPKNAGIGVWQCEANLSCEFVASKTGKQFYPESCKWAKRILAKNRLCFAKEEEAIKAGLKQGENC